MHAWGLYLMAHDTSKLNIGCHLISITRLHELSPLERVSWRLDKTGIETTHINILHSKGATNWLLPEKPTYTPIKIYMESMCVTFRKAPKTVLNSSSSSIMTNWPFEWLSAHLTRTHTFWGPLYRPLEASEARGARMLIHLSVLMQEQGSGQLKLAIWLNTPAPRDHNGWSPQAMDVLPDPSGARHM
jgi:hypothetical protein